MNLKVLVIPQKDILLGRLVLVVLVVFVEVALVDELVKLL